MRPTKRQIEAAAKAIAAADHGKSWKLHEDWIALLCDQERRHYCDLARAALKAAAVRS